MGVQPDSPQGVPQSGATDIPPSEVTTKETISPPDEIRTNLESEAPRQGDLLQGANESHDRPEGRRERMDSTKSEQPIEEKPPLPPRSEAAGVTPVAPTRPRVESPHEGTTLWQRRRYSRGVVLILLAMLRLVATTLLVFGLIGAVTYLTLEHYVGGRSVEVPRISGMSVEEALEKLDPAGLFLKLDRREYNDLVPRGSIIAQYPPPEMKVKTATPVRVVLSDGAARVRAPNLIGMTDINAGVAVRSIAQADLDVGEGAIAYFSNTRKGVVIAQDPPPNTPIPRGSKIKLLVSLGPRPADYNMPDLRNKTLQEAKASLSAMQLTLSEVREIDHAGAERGTVVAQQPAPGKRVTYSDLVVLTVATGLGENVAPRP